jgi:hypothetical protein
MVDSSMGTEGSVSVPVLTEPETRRLRSTMSATVHGVAGSLGLLLAASFWLATAVSELFLSADAVVTVKTAILYAIPILISSVVVAGGSGFTLSRRRKGRLIEAKKRRMRRIAGNGLLVLVPSAILLHAKAAEGQFDITFGGVQAIELVAGAVQITLLVRNLRDGLRLSGRLRTRAVRRAV